MWESINDADDAIVKVSVLLGDAVGVEVGLEDLVIDKPVEILGRPISVELWSCEEVSEGESE